MFVVMGEEVSIAGLRARQAARRAGIILRVQSVLILLLLVWFSNEYDHNEYFQGWAAKSLGVLGFLLNGTLAAFYAGILIAFYLNRPLTPVNGERVRRREPIVVSAETQ